MYRLTVAMSCCCGLFAGIREHLKEMLYWHVLSEAPNRNLCCCGVLEEIDVLMNCCIVCRHQTDLWRTYCIVLFRNQTDVSTVVPYLQEWNRHISDWTVAVVWCYVCRSQTGKEALAKSAKSITENMMSITRMMATQVKSSEETVNTLGQWSVQSTHLVSSVNSLGQLTLLTV